MKHFLEELEKFVAGAQKKIDDHYAKNFSRLEVPKLSYDITPNTKYVRIVSSTPNGIQRSVYCFIDTTNGDVLKSASWKAPAKGARGNIYNDDNGLDGVNEYGANYKR